ncbi:hypothetical protein ABCW43_02375 [Neorhizobium sp. IRAMC:178]|uniref:hypothetical protein n=1 Tax=Neorhizobium tunisiense TaxID=3144793 RepID=UPI0031F6BC59
MTEARHLAIFDATPSIAFVERWRSHVDHGGDPVEFEGISTDKPANMDGLVLLTEITRFRSEIPCPLCSPTTPKFRRGRLSYFPHEKTVAIIGHRCASTHISDYEKADDLWRKQSESRRFARAWPELQKMLPDLTDYFSKVERVLKPVQWVRERLDKDAPLFAERLYRELKWSQGEIRIAQDFNIRDGSGRKVLQKGSIGTLAGFEFVRPSFRPVSELVKISRILADLQKDLPPLPVDGTGHHPTFDEITKRGKEAYSLLKRLPELRNLAADTRQFFSAGNIDILKQWFRSGESIFAELEMKKSGNVVKIRANGAWGHAYSNVLLFSEMMGELPGPRALKGLEL